MVERQIKSRERVSERGEVFTAEREVNAMLDLVKQETERIDSRFLEPACGTGNFLVEILRRKLEVIRRQYQKHLSELELQTTIAVGDALTLREPVSQDATIIEKRDAKPITFSEWSFISDMVMRKDYHLAALVQAQSASVPFVKNDQGNEVFLPPEPIREYRPIHYLKIATYYDTKH